MGELIYSLDCKAIRAQNADMKYEPKRKQSFQSEATQTPAETLTTSVNK